MAGPRDQGRGGAGEPPRAALTALNPGLPAEAIQTAIDELARDRSSMSLEAANREIYRLLKDGIPISIPDREALAPSRGERGVCGPPARGGLGAAGAQRLPAGEPVQRGGQPLHLPPRSGGLCQRPALGGDRIATISAPRHRTKPENTKSLRGAGALDRRVRPAMC